MITATDLFAGAGGSSCGMVAAGIDVRIAANHWPTAIATHQANHPATDHDCADISQVDPRRYPRTDLLWASPSCTHHSRAQGKRRPSALSLFDEPPTTIGQLIDMEPDRSRATIPVQLPLARHPRRDHHPVREQRPGQHLGHVLHDPSPPARRARPSNSPPAPITRRSPRRPAPRPPRPTPPTGAWRSTASMTPWPAACTSCIAASRTSTAGRTHEPVPCELLMVWSLAARRTLPLAAVARPEERRARALSVREEG